MTLNSKLSAEVLTVLANAAYDADDFDLGRKVCSRKKKNTIPNLGWLQFQAISKKDQKPIVEYVLLLITSD